MKTGNILAVPKQNLVLMHKIDFKTSEIVMGLYMEGGNKKDSERCTFSFT